MVRSIGGDGEHLQMEFTLSGKPIQELLGLTLGEDVEEKPKFKLIWNKTIPTKVWAHAWRTILECIPTKTNISRWYALPSHANPQCIFCNSVPETVRHVIFECSLFYQLWMDFIKCIGIIIVLNSEPASSTIHFSKLLKRKGAKTFIVCAWKCIVGSYGRKEMLWFFVMKACSRRHYWKKWNKDYGIG